MKLLEVFVSGGVLMLPIGLCSVVAFGIIVERMHALSRSRVLPKGVLRKALDAVASQGHAELGKSELARVLDCGLAVAAKGPAQMREILEEALEAATLRLDHSLNWLASIAAVSPLLGLLGTVLGMIDVFAELMASQGADITPLASGISEALITTATGLGVAIPCVLFVAHFDRRVVRLGSEIETAARALIRQREAAGR